MGKRRAKKKPKRQPLRFDEKLVLNQWMLSLFEVSSFDKLAEHLKSLELEGLDENNVHKFLHQMKLLWEYEEFPGDTLLGYDQNIVKHTLALSEKRAEPLRWKYFQYLSLLFTEVYLDRFFRDPDKLLADLNQHVAKFNEGKAGKGTDSRLRAGRPAKAGLLECHRQRQDAADARQHPSVPALPEAARQGEGTEPDHPADAQRGTLQAAPRRVPRCRGSTPSCSRRKPGRCSRAGRSRSSKSHKLKEEMGEKTVAIDAFEGNNLVLVDEGHRGASASGEGAWMSARNRLCENGFSFEYSATFGQAMKGKKGARTDLRQEHPVRLLVQVLLQGRLRQGLPHPEPRRRLRRRTPPPVPDGLPPRLLPAAEALRRQPEHVPALPAGEAAVGLRRRQRQRRADARTNARCPTWWTSC